MGHLAVPEWKQCYLDYEHLKIFVRIIKEIVELLKVCEEYINIAKELNPEDESLFVDDYASQLITPQIEELKIIGHLANSLFFDAHKKSMNINRLFLHMKLLELRTYFRKCKGYFELGLEEKELGLLLEIVEFVYVESSYLEGAKELNLEGERKILKKHSKYANEIFETPRRRNKKVLRISKELNKLLNEIENFYVKNREGSTKINRDNLRLLSKKIETSTTHSFVFGSWVGICLSILGVLIAILAYTGNNIETDEIFNRDFPTWRGVVLFIFFIWVLGFNTYWFEKYSVSHRLIFEFNEHHYSTSTEVFMVAGFFSTFFLIMFAIYTLGIAKIVTLEYIRSEYLALFVWGLLVLFLINPIPILFVKSRVFTIKLLVRSFLAPLIGVSFPIVWMTDQIMTLITPLKDFAYSICYYRELAMNASEETHNDCSSASRIEVVFVVGAIVYTLRILQVFRQGYDKGQFFFEKEFFSATKYCFSLTTLTLSFLYKAGNSTIFAVWIVFASISTCYSYFWDVKMDWQLFEKGSPHRFLRKFLCYPVYFYYFVIFADFFFRLVWIFTLSPSIANQALGSPQIFSLVTGMAEIIRRGIWNMLRVEKEHIANCKHFKPIPATLDKIENLIMQNVEKRKLNETSEILQSFTEIERIIEENETELGFVKETHMKCLNELLEIEMKEQTSRLNETENLQIRIKQVKKRVQEIKQERRTWSSKKIVPVSSFSTTAI